MHSHIPRLHYNCPHKATVDIYAFAKILLYLLFSWRLESAFKGTGLGYSKRVHLVFRVGAVVCPIVGNVGGTLNFWDAMKARQTPAHGITTCYLDDSPKQQHFLHNYWPVLFLGAVDGGFGFTGQ